MEYDFKSLEKIFFLLRETLAQSMSDDIIKLSASLSYYTIFSLSPLLIIIIYVTGKFFGSDAVRGEIFGEINWFIGNNSTIEIQEMIKNIKISNNNYFAIIGIVTLLLGSMSMFVELQSSINIIWGLRVKPEKELKIFLRHRLISFLMIGSLGLLLLVWLVASSLIDILIKKTNYFFSHKTEMYLAHMLNSLTLFIIFILLIAFIFRALPDGDVAYRDTIIGATFTGLLFMIGKFGIDLYIRNSSIISVYGVASSLIVILLWVYYFSIILYFGAELTKVYALSYGNKIIPYDYVVFGEPVTIGLLLRKKLK